MMTIMVSVIWSRFCYYGILLLLSLIIIVIVIVIVVVVVVVSVSVNVNVIVIIIIIIIIVSALCSLITFQQAFFCSHSFSRPAHAQDQ